MKVEQHHWLDCAIELYVLAFGCITLDWGESRFYIHRKSWSRLLPFVGLQTCRARVAVLAG
jgi:hypothetical protein